MIQPGTTIPSEWTTPSGQVTIEGAAVKRWRTRGTSVDVEYENGQTWTLLVSLTKDMTCMVAAGEGWRNLKRKPVEPET